MLRAIFKWLKQNQIDTVKKRIMALYKDESSYTFRMIWKELGDVEGLNIKKALDQLVDEHKLRQAEDIDPYEATYIREDR